MHIGVSDCNSKLMLTAISDHDYDKRQFSFCSIA